MFVPPSASEPPCKDAIAPGKCAKEKGGAIFIAPPFNYSNAVADQELRLPGSTLTPGPIVEETATRWM